MRQLRRSRAEHRRERRVLVAFHRADGELEQHDPAAPERDLRPAVGATDEALPQAPVRVQLVAVGEEQLVQTRAADLFRAFGKPDDRVRRPSPEVFEPEVERLQPRRDVGLVVAAAASNDAFTDDLSGERRRRP